MNSTNNNKNNATIQRNKPINYRKICRYSLVFQAGALSLTWGYLIILLSLMEYYGNHTALSLVAPFALGIFLAGLMITLFWPLQLAQHIKSGHFSSFSLALWLFFGLWQLPFGTLLAVIQAWCWWNMHRQSA